MFMKIETACFIQEKLDEAGPEFSPSSESNPTPEVT
jgi:hypothetical protein